MDFKQILKTSYDKIADRYLSKRTTDSEAVHLLEDFIDRGIK